MAPRPRRADRVRGRARRRDGQRHVHPHRHHQQGVRHDLPGLLLEHQRGDLRPARSSRTPPAATPRCPPRCCTACAPTTRSRRPRARSSISAAPPTRPSSSARTASRLGSSKNGQFGFGFDPDAERFNPMSLTAGTLGLRPRAGRHRQGHGRRQRLRRGRPDRRGRQRPGAPVHDHRASPATARSTRSAARRSPSSTSPPRRRCWASAASTTRSSSPPATGVSSEQLVRDLRPMVPASRADQDRPAAGQRRLQGHPGQHQVRPVLPARLRVHRARRGRVRDLQHPVDHARPAHPRARHAAHARRVAAPDQALGADRGPGDGRVRLGRRASCSASALAKGLNALLPGLRHRPAAGLDGDRDADGHRRARARHRRHPDRQPLARPARDADRAGRRPARGRHPAAAARRAQAVHPDDDPRRRGRAVPGRRVRRRRPSASR